MMQSILLTSPAKSQATERLSDTPVVDGEGKSDELLKEQGLTFSNLLDSILTGKSEKSDGALLGEDVTEDCDEELAIDSTGEELLPEELNIDSVDIEQNVEEQLLLGDEIESSDLESPLSRQGLLEDTEAQDKEFVESNQYKATADKQTGSAILAQIEAALKVDTKLTDTSKAVQISNENPELSLQVKKGEEKTAINLNSSAFSSKDATLNANESDKPLSAEAAQSFTEKLDKALFSHKGESERSPFTAAIDSSAPASTNTSTSNLDKLINQNLQRTTSSELQQPLNLQDKHASALLGERILMMIGQGKQEVQIRLDPAELGSMNIKLQVQQDQVQLTIQTQVGQSRDIIEQNLPRLREQLAQQGVSLGEANVEQHNQQPNQNNQGNKELHARGHGATNTSSLPVIDDTGEWIAPKIALSAQGIDYYA